MPSTVMTSRGEKGAAAADEEDDLMDVSAPFTQVKGEEEEEGEDDVLLAETPPPYQEGTDDVPPPLEDVVPGTPQPPMRLPPLTSLIPPVRVPDSSGPPAEEVAEALVYRLRDLDDDDTATVATLDEIQQDEEGGGDEQSRANPVGDREPLPPTGYHDGKLYMAEGLLDMRDAFFGRTGSCQYNDVALLDEPKYRNFCFAPVPMKSALFTYHLKGHIEMFPAGSYGSGGGGAQGSPRMLSARKVLRCSEVKLKPRQLLEHEFRTLFLTRACRLEESQAKDLLAHGDPWMEDLLYLQGDENYRTQQWHFTPSMVKQLMPLAARPDSEGGRRSFRDLREALHARLEARCWVYHEEHALLRNYYPEPVVVGLAPTALPALVRLLRSDPVRLCFQRLIAFTYTTASASNVRSVPELSMEGLKRAAKDFAVRVETYKMNALRLYLQLKKESQEGKHTYCEAVPLREALALGEADAAVALRWLTEQRVCVHARCEGHVYLAEHHEDERGMGEGVALVSRNFLEQQEETLGFQTVEELLREAGAWPAVVKPEAGDATSRQGAAPAERTAVEERQLVEAAKVARRVAPRLLAMHEADMKQRLQREYAKHVEQLPQLRAPEGAPLCSEQMLAYVRFLSKPLSMVSGPGGSGKTAFLRFLFSRLPRETVIGTAFQGKNAGDLEKSLPGRCFTTHMLLYCHASCCVNQGGDRAESILRAGLATLGGGGRMPAPSRAGSKESLVAEVMELLKANAVRKGYGEDFPLEVPKLGGLRYKACPFERVRTLVCDEVSTQYTEIFWRLVYSMARCGHLSRVVLTGDLNQLPSIQTGDLMRQLQLYLHERGALTLFTHNHRVDQGSLLLDENAKRIAQQLPQELRFDGRVANLMALPSSSTSSRGYQPQRDREDNYKEALQAADAVVQVLRERGLNEYEHHIVARTNVLKEAINRAVERYYFEEQTRQQQGAGGASGRFYKQRGFHLHRKLMFKRNDFERGTVNNEILRLDRIVDELWEVRKLPRSKLDPEDAPPVLKRELVYSVQRSHTSDPPVNTEATAFTRNARDKKGGTLLRVERNRVVICSSLSRPGRTVQVTWDAWARRYARKASATTVHAFQGGQAHTVISVQPYCCRFDTKELYYTIFTRATHCLIHLGSRADLNRAITQQEPARRSQLAQAVGKACRVVNRQLEGRHVKVSLAPILWLREQEKVVQQQQAAAAVEVHASPPSPPAPSPSMVINAGTKRTAEAPPPAAPQPPAKRMSNPSRWIVKNIRAELSREKAREQTMTETGEDE